VLDRMMRAMDTGNRWHMTLACYSYSRWHGLSRWDAFVGAWQLFWIWKP